MANIGGRTIEVDDRERNNFTTFNNGLTPEIGIPGMEKKPIGTMPIRDGRINLRPRDEITIPRTGDRLSRIAAERTASDAGVDSMFTDGIPVESTDHMFAGGNPDAGVDSMFADGIPAESTDHMFAGGNPDAGVDSMFADGIPAESTDHMFAGGNLTDANYGGIPENDSFITISYIDADGHSMGYHGPISGIPGRGKDISISYEKINETIALLKKAITNLENSYSGIESDLKKISSEWLGKDAFAFTNSGAEINEKVSLAIRALTLLATTYQKAADIIQEKQNATKQIIDSLS